jgi:hypothetical protein
MTSSGKGFSYNRRLIKSSGNENTFGAMKKLLLLGFWLLALRAAPVIAQTGGPGVIVVIVAPAKAVITREDGKSEVTSIPYGTSDANLTARAQWYQKLLAQLYQAGYVLKSTFSETDYRTALIFVKGA